MQAAADYKYDGSYMNYGSYGAQKESVAYDLSRFDNRRRVREALEREPAVSRHGQAKVKSASAAKAAAVARPRRARLTAFAVLSYAAIFALLLMIVMNYMKLNEISVTVSKRADELAELQNEAALLEVEYEQKQNVSDISARAAELGLYAPTSAQISYIDLSKPDYAVVYAEEPQQTGLLAGLGRIVAAIGSFFE